MFGRCGYRRDQSAQKCNSRLWFRRGIANSNIRFGNYARTTSDYDPYYGFASFNLRNGRRYGLSITNGARLGFSQNRKSFRRGSYRLSVIGGTNLHMRGRFGRGAHH